MVFFEIKVKYECLNENTGKMNETSVLYVLDAVNFTDAETKITKELTENQGIHDFEVEKITKTKLEDVIGSDKEIWYLVEFATVDINEITGKERKINYQLLINADNITECKAKIELILKDVSIDYVIKTIKETNIKFFIKNKE